ncbi:hypothetical protein [Sandaracinus amylolyticus]|uniref:hypothetical protein n=1 Tax=Sandaracinus amylolyticus TaxID=927083 RepID=UPI001F398410|nr:hypothetical protein [Sandaracinus amylolyticus]UJR84141.1 Hypothetical protein I5071_62120 [Sandaracinus amylolyticus]
MELAISIGAVVLAACGPDPDIIAWRAGLGASTERSPEAEAALFPTTIHEPPELTSITTSDGVPGTACATCHSIAGVTPESRATSADEVGGPHAGLRFAHGSNTCGACHASDDPTSLRLADGRALPMREAMTLCAQCHGPQYRDYQHGSHGGMRGHWDRSVGPRERNHCVDCHDPHAPRYPSFRPMPPPRDRVAPVVPRHEGAPRHE